MVDNCSIVDASCELHARCFMCGGQGVPVRCLKEMDASKMNAGPKLATERRLQWKSVAGGVALMLWATILSVVIASLMVGHWVTLPHPEIGDQLAIGQQSSGETANSETANSETAEPEVSDAGNLTAYHFLYGECPCSQRILKRLLARPTLRGINEKIVLIGDNAEVVANASACGYKLDVVTPPELNTKYGVESAPLLVVTDRDAKILYSGGYTTRKQGPVIQDEAILLALMDGRVAEDLPVYGCAVSRELQALVDPFRLKY